MRSHDLRLSIHAWSMHKEGKKILSWIVVSMSDAVWLSPSALSQNIKELLFWAQCPALDYITLSMMKHFSTGNSNFFSKCWIHEWTHFPCLRSYISSLLLMLTHTNLTKPVSEQVCCLIMSQRDKIDYNLPLHSC